MANPQTLLYLWLARWCAEHPGANFFQSSILRDARNAIGAESATWKLLKPALSRLRSRGIIIKYADCAWVDGKPGWFTVTELEVAPMVEHGSDN